MENEFYGVMNALSDDELLKNYQKKSDYTLEAIQAMELVIAERKLENIFNSKVKILDKQKELSNEEIYNQFQMAEFGKVISDRDYAKEKLDNSKYLSKKLSPLHNYGWLFSLLIIFGIIGLMLTISIFALGEFKKPFNYIFYVSAFFALCLPIGIWKLVKNSAELNIVNLGRKNYVEIKTTKENFEIHFPLQVKYYWRWVHIKLNLKQVELVVLIFDKEGKHVIEIDELQVMLKPVPVGWEELPSNISSELKNKKVFGYKNYGTQKPFLIELQKIINGLQ